MPAAMPRVHLRESGQRTRGHFRFGVRNTPGGDALPLLPKPHHADGLVASLRGKTQRRVRIAYPVTNATPTPITPSSPVPAGGNGLPAGMRAAVVVAILHLMVMVV